MNSSTTTNTRYEINAIVCVNAETTRGYAESACSPKWLPEEAESLVGAFEHEADDYALAICSAVRESLDECGDIAGTATDGHFANWNGGMYASQSREYGYRSCGPAVLDVYEIVEDEDGVEFRTRLGRDDDLPDAVLAKLDRIETVVENAIQHAGTDISHAYAGRVMQLMADLVQELRESQAD